MSIIRPFTAKHPFLGLAQPRTYIAGIVIIATCLIASALSWPGFATHDTLFTTSEALQGTYTTYHPLLNGLLLRLLAVPFDSYALYTTLQIAFCGLVLHRALVLVAADSARMWPTIFSAISWGASASTVLYLGVIWKDVLTAYSLLYVAALLYYVRTPGYTRISSFDGAMLAMSLVLITGLRHGMVFNLVLLVILFGPRKVMAEPRLRTPFMVAGVVFVALALVSHSKLVRNDDIHYAKLKIAAISQPMLSIVTYPGGYTSDDHSYDGALMFDVFGPEFRSQYKADYFKNQVVLTDERSLRRAYRAILLRTPRLCLLNLGACMSGRVQMMLATLQPSAAHGGTTFYELSAAPSCRDIYAMTPQYCQVLDRFSSSERSSVGSRLTEIVQGQFVQNRGGVQNILIWNLFPALFLAIVVLAIKPFNSAQWIVACFFLLQLVLPFLTAMATDYRYYYFLALYFFVFFPKLIESFILTHRGDFKAQIGFGKKGELT